jgi:hypothetical protein
MAAPEEVSVLFVGLLVLTLVVMAFAGWFVVENSVAPDHIDTWLGTKAKNIMAD